MMLKGKIVDGNDHPCCLAGDRLVESDSEFTDRSGVLVARALVDGNSGEVMVQVLNLRS